MTPPTIRQRRRILELVQCWDPCSAGVARLQAGCPSISDVLWVLYPLDFHEVLAHWQVDFPAEVQFAVDCGRARHFLRPSGGYALAYFRAATVELGDAVGWEKVERLLDTAWWDHLIAMLELPR